MKLIELLARELKEWPLDTEQNNEYDRITQDGDGMLNGILKGCDTTLGGGTWGPNAGYLLKNSDDFDELKIEVAEDWATAIITQVDWDAYHAPATATTPTLETMLAEWRDLTARAQAAQAEADALFEHAGQCHGEVCVRLAELGWGAPRVAAVAGEPVVTLDTPLDMTDWRNLRPGDIIECVADDGDWEKWIVGTEAVVVDIEPGDYEGYLPIKAGTEDHYSWGNEFRFISRPSAQQ